MIKKAVDSASACAAVGAITEQEADPRTGEPCRGTASCSVIAPTAAQADALSTAFFIMGPEEARSYCDVHAEVGSIVLIDREDAIHEVPLTWGVSLKRPESW